MTKVNSDINNIVIYTILLKMTICELQIFSDFL